MGTNDEENLQADDKENVNDDQEWLGMRLTDLYFNIVKLKYTT
jgi:hypothetical protein